MAGTSGDVAAGRIGNAIVPRSITSGGDAAAPLGPVASGRAVQGTPHGGNCPRILNMNTELGKSLSQTPKTPAKAD